MPINYVRIENDEFGFKYMLVEKYSYYSRTFNRTITLPEGRKSDGATSARDLGAVEKGWRRIWAEWIGKVMKTRSNTKTAAWFVHDELCLLGKWDDGSKVSNFVASTVLSLILYSDGYKLESITWWFATFLGGGGQARRNGMFWVKK